MPADDPGMRVKSSAGMRCEAGCWTKASGPLVETLSFSFMPAVLEYEQQSCQGGSPSCAGFHLPEALTDKLSSEEVRLYLC